MSALESAIQKAISSEGNTSDANKAYLEFIKGNFIIPVEKSSLLENPKVLFFEEEGHVFLPVFSSQSCLDAWASEIKENIQLLKLSGVDLLKGIGDHVIVSLNIGSPSYKEFNPQELARMKKMVLKLFTQPTP